MQDKSSYANANPPKISEDLQEYINGMVEEIVLKGAYFETQKKWLQKYLEAENVNYENYERNFLDMLQLIDDYKHSKSSAKWLMTSLASNCFISEEKLQLLVNKPVISSNGASKETERPPKPLKNYIYLVAGIVAVVLLLVFVFLPMMNDQKKQRQYTEAYERASEEQSKPIEKDSVEPSKRELSETEMYRFLTSNKWRTPSGTIVTIEKVDKGIRTFSDEISDNWVYWNRLDYKRHASFEFLRAGDQIGNQYYPNDDVPVYLYLSGESIIVIDERVGKSSNWRLIK